MRISGVTMWVIGLLICLRGQARHFILQAAKVWGGLGPCRGEWDAIRVQGLVHGGSGGLSNWVNNGDNWG